MNSATLPFGFRNSAMAECRFSTASETLGATVQDFLTIAYRGDRRLKCLCGVEPPPEVWVVKVPQCSRLSTRRPYALQRHGPGCPVGLPVVRLGKEETSKPIYTPSVLDRTISSTEAGEATGNGQELGGNSGRYEDFTHFCNSALTRSLREAFWAVNSASAGSHENPTKQEVLRRLDSNLESVRFSNGATAREILQQTNREISFGVTNEPLIAALEALPGDPMEFVRLRLSDRWGRSGRGAEVFLDRGFKDAVLGRTRVRNGILKPPYLYIVIHGDGPYSRASQLYLQPVVAHCGQISPKESQLEGMVATTLMTHGVGFFKPRAREDLFAFPQLPRRLFVGNAYLPDFVLLAGREIVLLECAGLESRAYLENLERKICFYRSLRQHGIRELMIVRDARRSSVLLSASDVTANGYSGLAEWSPTSLGLNSVRNGQVNDAKLAYPPSEQIEIHLSEGKSASDETV